MNEMSKLRKGMNEIDESVSKSRITLYICLFICFIFYILIGNNIYSIYFTVGFVLFALTSSLMFVGNVYLSILRMSCWKIYKSKEKEDDKRRKKISNEKVF